LKIKQLAHVGRSVAKVLALVVLVQWPSASRADLQPRPGDPLPGLTADELARFYAGLEAYQFNLTPEQGLGPVFNQTSCASCHNNPVGGPGSQFVTHFGRLGKKGGFEALDQVGGTLLQAQSINDDCLETIPEEANVTTLRVTPGVLAYGLVEAILDSDLLAVQASQDSSIQGDARMVVPLEDPGGVDRVGRFGWKAQIATVESFSADAALNEMGMTNAILMDEVAPQGDESLIGECDDVADPEDPPDGAAVSFVQRVTDFQRYLAPPPQTPRWGMSGEQIFEQVGCSACHTPTYTTSNDSSLETALRNVDIHPYGDFLLHGMGLAGDGIQDGPAGERQLRTPPLWGLRYRIPIWHDGRFASGSFEDRVTFAIYEHGLLASQGIDTVQAFASLSAADQSLLIQFLDSLGRIEFDADGSQSVDWDDVFGNDDGEGIQGCFNQSCTPDDACAIHDVNQDGVVDSQDLVLFVDAFDESLEDCNGNSILDVVEIIQDPSVDQDSDGSLDVCERCPGDIDDSGAVEVNDVLLMLSAWGTCGPPCPADLDEDGEVEVDDILALLSYWGDCS
tara:strand:- start:2804 stop:4498 length:1695 start_codon:yes stop_codon:yes gene_type:complete